MSDKPNFDSGPCGCPYENRWDYLKQWLKEYKDEKEKSFSKINMSQPERYCIAVSVDDLLSKMDEIEEM